MDDSVFQERRQVNHFLFEFIRLYCKNTSALKGNLSLACFRVVVCLAMERKTCHVMEESTLLHN